MIFSYTSTDKKNLKKAHGAFKLFFVLRPLSTEFYFDFNIETHQSLNERRDIKANEKQFLTARCLQSDSQPLMTLNQRRHCTHHRTLTFVVICMNIYLHNLRLYLNASTMNNTMRCNFIFFSLLQFTNVGDIENAGSPLNLIQLILLSKEKSFLLVGNCSLN